MWQHGTTAARHLKSLSSSDKTAECGRDACWTPLHLCWTSTNASYQAYWCRSLLQYFVQLDCYVLPRFYCLANFVTRPDFSACSRHRNRLLTIFNTNVSEVLLKDMQRRLVYWATVVFASMFKTTLKIYPSTSSNTSTSQDSDAEQSQSEELFWIHGSRRISRRHTINHNKERAACFECGSFAFLLLCISKQGAVRKGNRQYGFFCNVFLLYAARNCGT